MIVVTASVWRNIWRGEPIMRHAWRLPNEKMQKHNSRLKDAASKNARTNNIIAMYRQGMTLAAIGAEYGLTRERIRQILAKNDIGKTDGGKYISTFLSVDDHIQKKKSKRAATEYRIYQQTGMDLDSWNAHVRQYGNASVKQSPYTKFMRQRNSAMQRGIEWDLTFAEWWSFWQESGKWETRGRGHKYGMARFGDSGPYVIGNIYICTGAQNSADSYLTKPADERVEKRRRTLTAKARS